MQTITADHHAATAAVDDSQTWLPLRDDTFLGVCEAIGEDFGFNPNWLRIALAGGLLWNVEAILGLYFGLGVIVLVSRLVFPKPRAAAAPAHEPVADEANDAREPERLAA